MYLKYPPFQSKVNGLLHGADYNPDQWLDSPEILAEDIRLMKLARCNVMSVGIFSWASLEPEEGVYSFEWLDSVLDNLVSNGIFVWLATPSGARPAWMAEKYPEVLRVGPNRVRNLFGHRHNHCITSPIYRRKVREMNMRLAQRYAHHPAVLGWHISNEYSGDCHCDLCQEAFRSWLKERYGTLENLNKAWWSPFWSHTITKWSQIESPAPHGETMVHGLNLDWKRFTTQNTLDFMRGEIEPLRAANPDLPVTTNFMEAYDGLDYWKFVDDLDVISWDSYPTWHDKSDDTDQAAWVSMIHDIKRSMKGGRPFVLMESTPSVTNWQPVSKLKRPGMHLLSCLQAVAHGADSVQYFQWRKSRGSSEKLHGAVVGHAGHHNTRVFSDVMQVGKILEELAGVAGKTVKPEAAVIFDWENRWAIRDAQGPRNAGMHYEQTVHEFYQGLWENGIPADVINMDVDFTPYRLLIAPMLYMVRPGVGERIAEFVKNGGTFVATYWSGIVNETDLTFLGGFPGPLRETLGIWSEEIDALHDHDSNHIVMVEGNELDMRGTYTAYELCDLIHVETAEVLARYGDDFYKGRPALTVNQFGKGSAYYVASRNQAPFHREFVAKIVQRHNLTKVLNVELPHGVTVQLRTDGHTDHLFVMNFTSEMKVVPLGEEHHLTDALTKEGVSNSLTLAAYDVKVLTRPCTGKFVGNCLSHNVSSEVLSCS
ncbi:Beta-galactosidase [Alicyclobacillus hesperidum URH17-3-68]|uniref:beta-galactosidase n=1 Tax=Alicyclobacillus hesperidum TaxID=89784 RepID=UPI000281BE9E|nr:beta-galactosidase [Alicyclobacillus hesperidum]EJY55577.1 Beta-galactosidase [Alicyclobacillus hesperidum URH17-3-68]